MLDNVHYRLSLRYTCRPTLTADMKVDTVVAENVVSAIKILSVSSALIRTSYNSTFFVLLPLFTFLGFLIRILSLCILPMAQLIDVKCMTLYVEYLHLINGLIHKV